MKAWQLCDGFGFDHLRHNPLPDPVPGPHEVLVRIRAASLNYRDFMVVTGRYNPKMSLPRIPCSDGAGVVEAVGPGVARVRVGDRVLGLFMPAWISGEVTDEASASALGGAVDGVLADQIILPAEGVVKIPETLSFTQAATLPCAAVTAWNALTGAGVKSGDTVLIQGTGGVSLFAMQFARTMGLKVLIISGSDEKLHKAMEMGAAAGLNYRTTPNWDRWVRSQTGERGVDCIIEVGGAGTLERSFKAVRRGGHIALIGVLASGAGINPVPILMKSIQVRGIYVGSRTMLEEMLRAITLHGIAPVIDRTFSFDLAVESLKYLETAAHFGKIVLENS